jgi:hypothetical protein
MLLCPDVTPYTSTVGLVVVVQAKLWKARIRSANEKKHNADIFVRQVLRKRPAWLLDIVNE